jgi:hypothetical protein
LSSTRPANHHRIKPAGDSADRPLNRVFERHRVEAACARALHLRSYSYRSVESILKHSLETRPLPGAGPAPHPAHDNVRGPGYYH